MNRLIKLSERYGIIKYNLDEYHLDTSLQQKCFSIVFEDTCVTCIIKYTDLDTPDEHWEAFKIDDNLNFELSGVLLSYLKPLAESHVSVLVVSSFDTDYIFVREKQVTKAVGVWQEIGVSIMS